MPEISAEQLIDDLEAEINQSLLADVSNYQIAMLNMTSSDINYAVKSNFPFYVEQYDPRVEMEKRARQAIDNDDTSKDGSAEAEKKAKDDQIKVGNTQGRRYPINSERPGFIHPSPDPLMASMNK